MTPKEKAKELFYKMSDVFQGNLDNYTAERCALIAVDEIINNNSKIPGDLDGLHIMENILFWEEVKHEIKNL
jgi:hypothetical protein